MRTSLRVAAVQMNVEPCATVSQFRERVFKRVQEAQENGAQLVVFPQDLNFVLASRPECFRVEKLKFHRMARALPASAPWWRRIAYTLFATSWFWEWRAQARMARVFHRVFSDAARAFQITLVAGSLYVRRRDGLYHISWVYGPDGVRRGEHAQNQILPAATAWGVKACNDARAIAVGGFRLGVLLGADADAPDVARRLRADGAQILVCPSGGWRATPDASLQEMAGHAHRLRSQQTGLACVRPYSCGYRIPGLFFGGFTSITNSEGRIVARSRSCYYEEVVLADVMLAAAPHS